MLTHANLLANLRAIRQGADIRPDDVIVSWLPLYHDMGLIGCWMGALYFGVPLVLMSPLAFLARPSRWLRAIHRHRGTLSAAPNFAYELCINKIPDDEIAGLDLSSWRMALNGAEPVAPRPCAASPSASSPHGFRPGAFSPVYGLAENSLAVAFPPLDRPPVIDAVERDAFQRTGRAVPAAADDPQALRFVSCGFPLAGHEVRVVDDGRPGAGGPAGGAAGVQGAVRQQRLLPQPRGHRQAGPRRLAGLGRPRLPRLRRALHHRPGQGHHHPRRPQPLSAGAGGGGGRGAGHPQRVRGGLRQPRSGHRHRAAGGDGRDPRARRGGARRHPPGRAGRHRRPPRHPRRRGGPGAAARGAQDLQRQDPPLVGARGLRVRARAAAAAPPSGCSSPT